MAYTVRRKQEKPARMGSAVLDKIRGSDKIPHASEAVREGAEEVKDKIRSDFQRLSQMAKFRRSVSLRHFVVCVECAGTGQVECLACGGTGEQKTLIDERVEKCTACNGTAAVTCGECAGRRIVPNTGRKKVLIVLVVGVLAWATVLFRLMGYDILPEQRAKYLAGGGGGGISKHAAPEPEHHLGELHGRGVSTEHAATSPATTPTSPAGPGATTPRQ